MDLSSVLYEVGDGGGRGIVRRGLQSNLSIGAVKAGNSVLEIQKSQMKDSETFVQFAQVHLSNLSSGRCLVIRLWRAGTFCLSPHRRLASLELPFEVAKESLLNYNFVWAIQLFHKRLFPIL